MVVTTALVLSDNCIHVDISKFKENGMVISVDISI